MKEVATRTTVKVVVSDNIRKSKFNGNQHTKKINLKFYLTREVILIKILITTVNYLSSP